MLAVYMITYDLNKKGKDYEGVFDVIKESSTGTWCKYWDSTWLIKSNLTAKQIAANISTHLDHDDSMIVIKVVNDKQGWLEKEQWEHINNNIFS